MKVLSVELVVFDMVGTTVRDDGRVTEAFKKALREAGLMPDVDLLGRIRGLAKREAIRQLLEEAGGKERIDDTATAVFEAFRAALGDSCLADPVLEVPGAEQTFLWLRERGIKVALTTGLDRSIAELILGKLNWSEGIFDLLVTVDEVERGRPAPDLISEACRRAKVEPSAVVVVGDTVPDVSAGLAARAGLVVGVTSGAHSLEALTAAGAHRVLETVEQIRSFFEELGMERSA